MMSVVLSRHGHTKQQGASVLEFMVMVPILITLAFTAIEFGAIFTRLNMVTKTVQDAARYLSTGQSAANQAIATNLIQYNSVNSDGGQVLPGAFAVNIQILGTHVNVTATYNHTPIAGEALSNLVQLIGGNPIDLSLPLTASSYMPII